MQDRNYIIRMFHNLDISVVLPPPLLLIALPLDLADQTQQLTLIKDKDD